MWMATFTPRWKLGSFPATARSSAKVAKVSARLGWPL